MRIHKANVVDVLRCNQRDEAIVSSLQSDLLSFFKLFGAKYHQRFRRHVSVLSELCYYYTTTLGNLQTLGEEYSGIIRVNGKNIPSQLVQTLWLLLYVGGEPLIDGLLDLTKKNIRSSTSLRKEAKDLLGKYVDFILSNKILLRKIHQSLFYFNGDYYHFSNRTTRIRYALLREWFKDDTYEQSFKLLGKISLFYVLFILVQKLCTGDQLSKEGNIESDSSVTETDCNKICVLCNDARKNSSVIPCGHIFCWNCIYESLSYQKTCPLCRQDVHPNRIILLQNYA